MKELIENLVDCRRYNCNFLLNTGLKGNGAVNLTDQCLLKEIGKWIKINKDFIYGVSAAEIDAENAFVLKDEKFYYTVIKDTSMSADPNVQLNGETRRIKIHVPQIEKAEWLDNGEKVSTEKNEFLPSPFAFGTSLSTRVMRFTIRNE